MCVCVCFLFSISTCLIFSIIHTDSHTRFICTLHFNSCPSVVEDNVVCKKWGSIGCIDPEKDGEPRRIVLMRIGFFFNFVAFLLTLFACTSIHIGGGKAIQSAAFSSCDVSEVENFFTNVATIDIGLRGVALQTPALRDNFDASDIQDRQPLLNVDGGLQVITFDEFCVQGQNGPNIDLYVKDGQCEACQDISNSLVSSIIMSTISFVPTLSTDILRMYYNYDVNCQKFFATVLSFFTMIMSINTLVQYSTLCFDSFYEGTIPLNDDLSVIRDDEANPSSSPSLPTFVLHFDWHMGPGLICLYLGTILKVIDIAVNILLPTPTITRNADEQEEYEQQHSLRVLQQKQKKDTNDEENPK